MQEGSAHIFQQPKRIVLLLLRQYELRKDGLKILYRTNTPQYRR
ncbi:hypothetical protein SAMN00120144_2880 [Hymenobacter roseosalivarius DSM 11622]|uniref:Uncharacterized protein n=1 Tax=Hymenobacter roseosalivarius DSM 11622 TaxID=645990 RepID=A0A1W1VIE8_9BACT|nr:hypothetical protein SAMN00120144_2880 [Hymenobacter roseosalivarius DSM 11622]